MRPLFRLEHGSHRDPEVEAWLRSRAENLAPLAQHWFNALRDAGPDVVEMLHDGHPTACVGDAAFAYVNVFSAHTNVGFFQGAELHDPAGLLTGTGKFMRHVKIKPGVAVDEPALHELIREAYTDVKQRLAAEGR